MTTIKLGVSGLRRTGKTVLLTALIHQLEQRGTRGLRAFDNDRDGWTRHLLAGKRKKQWNYEPFPYDEHLERLRDYTNWPKPTVNEFGYELTLRCNWSRKPGYWTYAQSYVTANRLRIDDTYTLQIYDYPGEYLLDAEMALNDYESWSERAVSRMPSQCKRTGGVLYRRYIEPAAYEGLSDAAAIEEARSRYVAYVRHFRADDANTDIEFIQPSISAMDWMERLRTDPNSDPSREELPFVPLPKPLLDRQTLVEGQRREYREYVAKKVNPFVRRIRACDRHIFLVDVLRIVNNGLDSLNDTRRCIRAAVEAFAHESWYRWLWKSKLMFAAAKADHVPKRDRDVLHRLLRELVVDAAAGIDGKHIGVSSQYISFASIRATDDDGGDELKGTLKDNDSRKRYKPLPHQWPQSDEEWKLLDSYPEYRPQPFPRRDDAPWHHLRLDELTYWVFYGE